MVPSSAAEVQPVVAVVALGWVLSNPVWALSWWYVVHAPLGTMGVAARWLEAADVGAACATDTALKATLRQAAATSRSPFTPKLNARWPGFWSLQLSAPRSRRPAARPR